MKKYLWLTLLIIGILSSGYTIYNKIFGTPEDWYLGCADADGKEYLVKVKGKPRINGAFIEIGKDTYLTPRPMMTCRAVPATEIDIPSTQQVV